MSDLLSTEPNALVQYTFRSSPRPRKLQARMVLAKGTLTLK